MALMLAWSAMPVGIARRWVHAAGASWAAACLAIWVQTALGRAVTDLASVTGVAAAALLGIWILAALRALVAWRTAPVGGAFAGTTSGV